MEEGEQSRLDDSPSLLGKCVGLGELRYDQRNVFHAKLPVVGVVN